MVLNEKHQKNSFTFFINQMLLIEPLMITLTSSYKNLTHMKTLPNTDPFNQANSYLGGNPAWKAAKHQAKKKQTKAKKITQNLVTYYLKQTENIIFFHNSNSWSLLSFNFNFNDNTTRML